VLAIASTEAAGPSRSPGHPAIPDASGYPDVIFDTCDRVLLVRIRATRLKAIVKACEAQRSEA
jgi:hypothetical protein